MFQYQEKDEEVTGMKNIQIKSFELANFGKNSGEKNVKVEPLFNTDQSPREKSKPSGKRMFSTLNKYSNQQQARTGSNQHEIYFQKY